MFVALRTLVVLLVSWVAVVASAADAPKLVKPNVLFISTDDLNDWVGCLHGHPLVKTPNIDRLAARGTLFTNAHCQSPLCNPSRTSLLLGLRPTTTGIYGLAPAFQKVDAWRDRVTLPQAFSQSGYRTYALGKIFHHGLTSERTPAEFDVVGKVSGKEPKPPHKLAGETPMGNNSAVDWGVFPHDDADKFDSKAATWAVEQLQQMPSEQPFFLAVGFHMPHVPFYATQKWFDLYPDDDTLLPPVDDHDRDDTPRFSWYLHWQLPEPRLKWLRDNHQWRSKVRAYLACISFLDSQVGRVLDALDKSGQADNTIVVFWSDHGYHLGEKLITGKNTLWERSTHVPLVFAGPGIERGARCTQPVELLDLYPTLAELSGLTAPNDLEGHSLVPQLRDALAKRPWPAITSHNQGNHAVCTERWRYIRYADGSEELYDKHHDLNEWKNLAGDRPYAPAIAVLRQWLPKIDRPLAPDSASRILTYDPKTGEATWQGKPIGKDDPVPE